MAHEVHDFTEDKHYEQEVVNVGNEILTNKGVGDPDPESFLI